MRGLLILVIAMGVLIVAGVAVIGLTVAHRLTRIATPADTPFTIVLDEPALTQIVSVTALGDKVAIILQRGGPDRVVILDVSSGRNLGQVQLAR